MVSWQNHGIIQIRPQFAMAGSPAPATAGAASPPRPPRVSPVKALLVVLFLAALTPFWVLYGLVGSLLSASGERLSHRGIALLVALALAIVAEVVHVEIRHKVVIHEAENSPGTYTSLVAALGAVLGALIYAQFKFHALLQFVFDRPSNETEGAMGLLSEFVAPFFLLFAMWAPISKWKHWELVTGLSIYLFFAVYFAVPIVVASAHAKFWVPARYAELERIERELLEKNLSCKFELLKVAGLGTVYVPCTSKTVTSRTKKTLVLVHGYAAGNALWACNLEFLAQYYDVYAIEWVGKGRSDRPDFTSYEHADADKIFVDGIEKWRKALKLEKFYLAGHSLGAMFVSSYAVRYPGRAEHLVLISPAGVSHPPPPKPVSFGLRVFRYLWSLKLTPMSVARYAGPFGPALIRFVARTRIGVMPETSAMRRGQLPLDTVGEYWYHNWALKASGEVAMHTHLHPGVFAKKPICEMLTPKTVHVPITFMYGGGPDWMEPRHAYEFAKKFHGHARVPVQVLLVPGAGHQVFTDNVDDFNMMLHQALEGKQQ